MFSSLQPTVSHEPSDVGGQKSRAARRSTRNSTRIALKKSEECEPSSQDKLPVPKDTNTSTTDQSPVKNKTRISSFLGQKRNENENARLSLEERVVVRRWQPEDYEDYLTEDMKVALRNQLSKYPSLKQLANYQQRAFVRQMRNCLNDSICIREVPDENGHCLKILDMPRRPRDYLALIPKKNLLQLVILTRDIKKPGERNGDFEIIVKIIREQILEITDNFPKYEVGELNDFKQIEGLLLMLITMVRSQYETRKNEGYLVMHDFTLFLADLISRTQIPEKKVAGPNSAIVFCMFHLLRSV